MTSSSDAYKYQVLHGDEFRLLELQPGAGHDPLVCDIRVVSLASNPYFQALSYCWGTGARSSHVVCDDAFVSITQDLTIALQHLRSAKRERILWIDQICINQEDEPERAAQVNIMRTIYSQANEVLVWLGAGDDQIHLALNLIDHTIKKILPPNPSASIEVGEYPLTVQLSPPDSPEWTAFRALLNLSWFTRVWTYQELTLAQKALLLYGHDRLDWNGLVVVYNNAKQCGETSGLSYLHNVREGFIVSIFMGNQLRLNARDSSLGFSIGRPTQELLNLVRSLRQNGATDPRDKIYAVLGVANDIDSTTPTADYAKHYRCLYGEFTKWCIHRYSDLAVLSLVNILPEMGKRGQSTCFELPSWCPDFRSVSYVNNMRLENGPSIIQHDKHRAYNATGASTTTLVASEDMLLSIHGLHIGTITDLTDPSGNLNGHTAIGEKLAIGGQWSKCAEAHSTNGLYPPTNEPILLAFSRLRVGDYLPGEINAALRRQRQHPPTYAMLQPGNVTFSNTCDLVRAANCDIGIRILTNTTRQRMYFTDSGYMGLCHRSCEVSDEVYLLMGSDMPVILRRLSTERFQFKGLSYVHGIMDGEYLLRLRDGGSQMTDEEWLQSLKNEPLPFETEVVTLV